MEEAWEEEGEDNPCTFRGRKVSQRAWQPLQSKLRDVERKLCTRLLKDTLRRY